MELQFWIRRNEYSVFYSFCIEFIEYIYFVLSWIYLLFLRSLCRITPVQRASWWLQSVCLTSACFRNAKRNGLMLKENVFCIFDYMDRLQQPLSMAIAALWYTSLYHYFTMQCIFQLQMYDLFRTSLNCVLLWSNTGARTKTPVLKGLAKLNVKLNVTIRIFLDSFLFISTCLSHVK